MSWVNGVPLGVGPISLGAVCPLAARTGSGFPVGEVTDVLHHGQDILAIRPAGPAQAEILVPFVKAIVTDVDVAAGILIIDPPAGLLDPGDAV